MKVLYQLLLTCTALICTGLISCPTCVGRVSRQSASFFSDECYQNKKRIDSMAPDIKATSRSSSAHKK